MSAHIAEGDISIDSLCLGGSFSQDFSDAFAFCQPDTNDTALVQIGGIYDATGGLVLDGIVDAQTSGIYDATGGLVLDDASDIVVGTSWASAASLSVTGSAGTRIDGDVTGFGGCSLTGDCVANATTSMSATTFGAFSLAGSGGCRTSASVAWYGSIGVRGESVTDTTQGFTVLPNGSATLSGHSDDPEIGYHFNISGGFLATGQDLSRWSVESEGDLAVTGVNIPDLPSYDRGVGGVFGLGGLASCSLKTGRTLSFQLRTRSVVYNDAERFDIRVVSFVAFDSFGTTYRLVGGGEFRQADDTWHWEDDRRDDGHQNAYESMISAAALSIAAVAVTPQPASGGRTEALRQQTVASSDSAAVLAAALAGKANAAAITPLPASGGRPISLRAA